ncbi:hypothetical protein [Massilia eburnea]|uniref:hypothetical protein n=1 Tax=Massilia eburnea TaxID=1776165 RepID=UPI003D6B45B2
MNLKISRLACCLVSALATSFAAIANAGAPGGPYVIWVNLSENASIGKAIGSRIDSKSDCDYAGLIVVPLPDQISKDLVKSAILDKNKKSLKILKAQLKKPYSSLISEGFDGLIAYDETNVPRISAASLVWPNVIGENLGRNSSEKDQWELFCSFIPPVGRSGL